MLQEDGGFVEWWHDRDSWKSGFRHVELTTEEKNKIAALCLMGKEVCLPCGGYWYFYAEKHKIFCLKKRGTSTKYVSFKTDYPDLDIA